MRDTFSSGVLEKPLDNDLYRDGKRGAGNTGRFSVCLQSVYQRRAVWKSYLKGAYIGVSPATSWAIYPSRTGRRSLRTEGRMDDLEKYGKISIKECVVTGEAEEKSLDADDRKPDDKELIVTRRWTPAPERAMMGAIGNRSGSGRVDRRLWKNYEIKRIVANEEKDANVKLYKQ